MEASPIAPPPLEAGARIHVVAPSGPVDPQRLERGLALLRRRGFEVIEAPNLRVRSGYFAGEDPLRQQTLQAALDDPAAQAVWCARGGYGLTRILKGLHPQELRRHPKWVVGFSDASALLAWVRGQANLQSIHGPVLAQLRELHLEDQERVFDALQGQMLNPLSCEQPGCAGGGGTHEGELFASNLELLRTLVGTPHMPDLRGCILALEEVGERPYRIDRALEQLKQAGAFKGLRAVAIGQLRGCTEPSGTQSAGPSALEVISSACAELALPFVSGFEFGHAPQRNAALVCGGRARLDIAGASLEFL